MLIDTLQAAVCIPVFMVEFHLFRNKLSDNLGCVILSS